MIAGKKNSLESIDQKSKIEVENVCFEKSSKK
jgi:hypothetical protein